MAGEKEPETTQPSAEHNFSDEAQIHFGDMLRVREDIAALDRIASLHLHGVTIEPDVRERLVEEAERSLQSYLLCKPVKSASNPPQP